MLTRREARIGVLSIQSWRKLPTDQIRRTTTVQTLRRISTVDRELVMLTLRGHLSSTKEGTSSELAHAIASLNAYIYSFGQARVFDDSLVDMPESKYPLIKLEDLIIAVQPQGQDEALIMDVKPPSLELLSATNEPKKQGQVFRVASDGVYADIPDPRPNLGELEWRFSWKRMPRKEGTDEAVEVLAGDLLEVDYLYDEEGNLCNIGVVKVIHPVEGAQAEMPHATGLYDIAGRIRGEVAWKDKIRTAMQRSGKQLTIST